MTLLATQENISKKGRPETYSDASLIVFYTVMTLKGITTMRAQQDYLFHHPLWKPQRWRLPACPSHVTHHRCTQTFTDAGLALCRHLFGAWCPRVATRNVNESPMGLTYAKHNTHQNCFSIEYEGFMKHPQLSRHFSFNKKQFVGARSPRPSFKMCLIIFTGHDK